MNVPASLHLRFDFSFLFCSSHYINPCFSLGARVSVGFHLLDRAFLWAAGLLGAGDFFSELERWKDDPSHPPGK